MKETLIHLILGISLFGWCYLGISPIGQEYAFCHPSHRECSDFLGSSLYLHPKECHRHPTPFNCRILGPSIASQQGWSFTQDCIQTKGFGFLPR